jgi:hypothetical protein
LSRIQSLKAFLVNSPDDHDLIESANDLCKIADVTLAHVRGHAGIEGNEICDGEAKNATDKSEGQLLEYTYEAAKSRVQSTLRDARKARLRKEAERDPEGRLACASLLTDGFERNPTGKSDLPRRSAVIVNQLEVNTCPTVFPEENWVSPKLRKCQFCGGSGSVPHLLLHCRELTATRATIFGAHAKTTEIIANPLGIASFVREAVKERLNRDSHCTPQHQRE